MVRLRIFERQNAKRIPVSSKRTAKLILKLNFNQVSFLFSFYYYLDCFYSSKNSLLLDIDCTEISVSVDIDNYDKKPKVKIAKSAFDNPAKKGAKNVIKVNVKFPKHKNKSSETMVSFY